jgi:hypothetical protein
MFLDPFFGENPETVKSCRSKQRIPKENTAAGVPAFIWTPRPSYTGYLTANFAV